MRAHLGINNCFAAKRWPLPEDWARIIRDDLGLDLVELSLDLLEGMESSVDRMRLIEDTRAALATHGLTAQATFTGLSAYSHNLLMHPDPSRRRAALDWYQQVVDLTAELGARMAGGHVGSMSVPDWMDTVRREKRWTSLKADLASIAAVAHRRGLDCLLVENLVTLREPSTMVQIEDLLTDGDEEHVPWRLCLDVGHHCVSGTEGDERDPYAWLSHFGSQVKEVQLQQSDAVGDHHWPFTPEFDSVGRIDPGRVLDTLIAANAGDVLLILEVIPGWEEQDNRVVRSLQLSVAVWREALRQRGLDG